MTLRWGSWQWITCGTLPQCLWVVGGGILCKTLPHYMGAKGRQSPLWCSAALPRGVVGSLIPLHWLPAWGLWVVELPLFLVPMPWVSGRSNSCGHTAFGQGAAECLRYTDALPWGSGPWIYCSTPLHWLEAHCLWVGGSGTLAAQFCTSSRGGGCEKSDSVGVFENPPIFKMVCGGVLRVFFDADTPFVRNFFGGIILDPTSKFLSLRPIQPLLILSP